MTRAARIAVLVGGVGSVALMFRAGYRGRGNPPPLLMVLFTFWVLSPFAALAWAGAVSRRWSALTRMALQVVTLFVALVSLGIYGYFALGPERAQVAPPFVLVPPLSWLLSALVLATAALVARRRVGSPLAGAEDPRM
jgi:hypothetical protein